MQKRVFRVYFISEKYVLRVCFKSPFYEDDIQPEIEVAPPNIKPK